MSPAGRRVLHTISAHRQLEGGGFPVRRPFPSADLDLVDPFLLLDEMGPVSWAAGEAIGAPDHPHRGFETVTYLIEGSLEHRDSQGNHGTLRPGGVQWMTAGSGVIHSEMPGEELLRDGGAMHGFQLWVNLPAAQKMRPPRYQERVASEIPSASSDEGRVQVHVIAGRALGVEASIETAVPITYLHFRIKAGGAVTQPLALEARGVVYVFSGAGEIGGSLVGEGQLALLSQDEAAVELAVPSEAEVPMEALLLAGVPLREAVARYGPFVMNTEEEIVKAIRDYQAGRLV